MITAINGYVGHTEEDGEKWTVVLHLTCESETEAKGFLGTIIENVIQYKSFHNVELRDPADIAEEQRRRVSI